MSLTIHNNPASIFQFLDTSKSKAKYQNKLGNNYDFNSHLKNQEAKAQRRKVDNVDITHIPER